MITNLFLSVVGISASISLIVVALILFTSILNKRYAAKWKYFIWIVLALRLVVPLSGANVRSIADMLSQMKMQAALQSEEQADALADVTAPPAGRVIVEIPAQMTMPIAVQSEKNGIRITLLDIAAYIWMIGCLAFMSVHLFSYWHYKRQVIKRGTVIRDARILRQISALKRELHIKGRIYVAEYPEAASPMILGFLKPVLVLPEEQYSSEELFFILKHEMVHLKRGDVYVKLLFVAANAVHWFNPLIWLLQKEAVIDMELSCDERVMQGANFAVRKAYTETLLSMLHRRCTKRTVLSTQFYGGKKIMKKRFKNILMRKGKKNGIFILLCAVVLTISLGALVGCSVKEPDQNPSLADTQKETAAPEKETPSNHAENQPESTEIPTSAGNDEAENTMMLAFSKEGQIEQKRAALMAGDGYFIYLPDEEWQKADSDEWTMVVNDKIRLWITHFEQESIDEIEEELAGGGYEIEGYGLADYHQHHTHSHSHHTHSGEDDCHIAKYEGSTVYGGKLHQCENEIWGVFYCYPVEAEEGWGRELPVIADTFVALADRG